jgi:hypothetical protein
VCDKTNNINITEQKEKQPPAISLLISDNPNVSATTLTESFGRILIFQAVGGCWLAVGGGGAATLSPHRQA